MKAEQFRERFFAGAPRYRWLSTLGRGGAGIVFKALDLDLDDVVAIKVLAPDIDRDDAALLARFKRELSLNRRIKHPNVARMHDFGISGDLPYITMEFLPGQDLWTKIQQKGRLSPSEAVAILRQVARGSEAVHRLGIVHRDLKSQNVIVDDGGAAVIVDFGLARGTGKDHFTLDSVIVGTPHYMSPEQVEGEEVDNRADIYSIGVIAFEALTGHPPFDGGSPVEVAMKHVNEEVPDDLSRIPEVPRELAGLILRCLEKERDMRPASAADLETELAMLNTTAPAGSPEVVRAIPKLWDAPEALLDELESALDSIVVDSPPEPGPERATAAPEPEPRRGPPTTEALRRLPAVLVVSGDPRDVAALSSSLAEEGLKPMYAAHGQEALETLFRKRVDLVLMDSELPGMDGFDVARVIRSQQRFSSIPILLAARKRDRSHLAFAIQSGAADLIGKPFAVKPLADRIWQILHHLGFTSPTRRPEGRSAMGRRRKP